MMYSAQVVQGASTRLFVITAPDAASADKELRLFIQATHWQGFIRGTCQPATPQEVQMADYALFAENTPLPSV